MLQVFQGIAKPRPGLDALLDVVASLQGAPVPASILESEILSRRLQAYKKSDLDTLIAAGEVVWRGVEPLGERDGKIALYLADSALGPPGAAPGELSERSAAVLRVLRERGASFFSPLHEAAGGGYPGETSAALWELVFLGHVTNDGFGALRAFVGGARRTVRFRSRRHLPPESQGRWSLVTLAASSPTEQLKSLAEQLLSRYGLVTREVVRSEGVAGGFTALYPVFRALEEAGRIRRGLFVAGLGAAQFALPSALETLRSLRQPGEIPLGVCLAAADPANPYGTFFKWPAGAEGLGRFVGASVVLVDGTLAAYFRRGSAELQVFEDDEPRLGAVAEALRAAADADVAFGAKRGLLIGTINDQDATRHPLARFLSEKGFQHGARGYYRSRAGLVPAGA
jgi:ATP-dependent Lhr-like helicase